MPVEIRNPELIRRIQRLSAAHGNSDIEDLLDCALTTQEEQDRWLQDQQAWIEAKIQRGAAELDRGEGIPSTRLREYLESRRSHRGVESGGPKPPSRPCACQRTNGPGLPNLKTIVIRRNAQYNRPVDAAFNDAVKEAGRIWARCPERPRPSRQALQHWNQLIDDWVRSNLPLVIRKNGPPRGSVVCHASGRALVFADNSPAQWVYRSALDENLPTLADVRQWLERDQIPFAFILKAKEREHAIYKHRLGHDGINSIGQEKFKLCHIEPVGLGTRTPVSDLPIDQLKNHCRQLLRPSNHFLVPLALAGLGEIPEVIQAVARADTEAATAAWA